jgi:hypothetical protein
MYYFSLITSDYCKVAEIGLISFFKYNDVILHLYVVDDGYADVVKYYANKPYSKHLDIINEYNEEFHNHIFSYEHNNAFFSSHIALLTLWTFKILDDIPEDECIRIDLDVLYFSSLENFSRTTHALNGVEESAENYRVAKQVDVNAHTPKKQINVGICKFIKSKYHLTHGFVEAMYQALDNNSIHYLIPEQDLLNELTDDKYAWHDSSIITLYVDVSSIDINKDILAVHFNGTYTKPWVIYGDNNVPNDWFLYCCGIYLCSVFSKKYNFFTTEVADNKKYAKARLIKTNDYTEQCIFHKVRELAEIIKSW